MALFTENLSKDPQSEEDPAEFLFHVRGVGGVGKSTLLRQWQEAARRADAVTAVVDENDVHGVEQALVELARQLAEQGGSCKEFDKAVDQFRRDQAVAGEPLPAEGEASVSSRVVTQAALGAVSLVPGAGVVTAMVNQDAAAQGLDRLRSASQARVRRRGARGDEAGLSRAFVAELDRLCRRHQWVVLFFDTWEQTAGYLDGWLLRLLEEEFGAVPANVMVVLAGRDELAEREWASLRGQVADVPLEVLTEAETRSLITARGVTDPGVVEAVLRLSMGLPLLVELLALSRPHTVEDVDAGGDLVDVSVERFVQWITDAEQREAVRACALPLQLNEDVFAAATGPGGQGLWEWLCGQPFVSGRGGFKHYHAVVRASMVRQERTHSPQGWASAHLRLADTHAAWRATVEERLPEAERWKDPEWRRHRLDETYHRLCAHPVTQLTPALEQVVHAADQDTAVLRQWIETLEQAAQDTTDAALLSWSGRLRDALVGDEPEVTCLGVLLSHGHLHAETRSWAYTYRGRRLYFCDRDEEALTELDRAIAHNARNARAWARRGETHRWLGHHDEAVSDLTTALEINPTYAWALASRGQAHQQAGRYDQAITDLTAALQINPTYAWALASRGQAHQQAGRYDQAITDFTAALQINPTDAWVLARRGETHQQAGRYDQAITDLTAALQINPAYAWALAYRGESQRQAGQYDQAITDFSAALQINPTDAWVLAHQGEAQRQAERYSEAVSDFSAALQIDPAYAWALSSRGQAHRQAGRYDQAVTDFTAALQIDPTDTWALTLRGETHRQAGRYDQAVSDLTAALEIDPTLVWAFTSRGQAHQQAGRYDQAVTDFTAALQVNPTYVWALAHRGETHRQAGRYDQAVSDLTAALEINPTDAWTLSTRGEAHQQAGRYDQAVSDLTAALEINPSDAWTLSIRGRAHRQAGHYGDARMDLERGVEVDPDDLSCRFEKLMFDTVHGGLESCAEQWSQLLVSPMTPPDEGDMRFLDLFRALLLEPENRVAEATEGLIATQPGPGNIADMLSYLAELSAAGEVVADRARQCHDLIIGCIVR
ncbi:tetratricopeptide repeat protein [Streptomyces xanthophaeus]|uniref:tetratricopeptide repeat protein n=1 Tax=Streptomyces xanthophaeus TaxID=67385 RepID=UPI003862D9E2|nr:tetratricopeptide repeat protein [Streptomyces xanthophaeus]WST64950.1 tetratricopeptide repeat protein [Streptomyces xanthophaeus]